MWQTLLFYFSEPAETEFRVHFTKLKKSTRILEVDRFAFRITLKFDNFLTHPVDVLPCRLGRRNFRKHSTREQENTWKLVPKTLKRRASYIIPFMLVSWNHRGNIESGSVKNIAAGNSCQEWLNHSGLTSAETRGTLLTLISRRISRISTMYPSSYADFVSLYFTIHTRHFRKLVRNSWSTDRS